MLDPNSGHIELSKNVVEQLFLKNAYRVTQSWRFGPDYLAGN